MEQINEAYTSALVGTDAADGDKVTVKDISAVSGTANGNKTMTLAELSRALNRTTTISGDGAITISPGTVKLTKGSAAAITLAAPTAAQEGTTIVVTAGSAFAHVITATGLLEDGVTGGAKNTATFGAFVGATITLAAINLKWHVVSKNVVTVA